MFIITYELNNMRDNLCVQCSNIETAVDAVDSNAKIISWEKLY